MERHQAGLEDTLVEVHVERKRLNLTSRLTASPANPNHCFKAAVALAILMGLVIMGLVVGFILHGVMSKSEYKQDSAPQSDRTNVSINCSLQNKSDQPGKYDIYTTSKDGTYLIYGRVKCRDPNEPISLEYRWIKRNRSDTIQETTCSCAEVFFAAEVELFSNTVIYLSFNKVQPDDTECLFHVYEL